MLELRCPGCRFWDDEVGWHIPRVFVIFVQVFPSIHISVLAGMKLSSTDTDTSTQLYRPQVYDTSELSCSNGENASVIIEHRPGSIPEGTVYDTHMQEVTESDDGDFEYVITDLTPGNVSATIRAPFFEHICVIIAPSRAATVRIKVQFLARCKCFGLVPRRHGPRVLRKSEQMGRISPHAPSQASVVDIDQQISPIHFNSLFTRCTSPECRPSTPSATARGDRRTLWRRGPQRRGGCRSPTRWDTGQSLFHRSLAVPGHVLLSFLLLALAESAHWTEGNMQVLDRRIAFVGALVATASCCR